MYTYKYGTAQDVGGFQVSIENGRYPTWHRPFYGITDFNFTGVPNRPNANIFARKKINTPIPETSALLLEKILIFNYSLQQLQQPHLQNRGIITKHGLPPGNSIFR